MMGKAGMRSFTRSEKILADAVRRELPFAEVFAIDEIGLFVMVLAEVQDPEAHDVVAAVRRMHRDSDPSIDHIPVTIGSK